MGRLLGGMTMREAGPGPLVTASGSKVAQGMRGLEENARLNSSRYVAPEETRSRFHPSHAGCPPRVVVATLFLTALSFAVHAMAFVSAGGSCLLLDCGLCEPLRMDGYTKCGD